MNAASAPATLAGSGPLLDRWDRTLMPNYGTPALVLVAGNGCTVWDADGRRYLDLLAGLAVNLLGHAHPAVVAAVRRQVATLGHVSNLYATEPAIRLAERLLEVLGHGDGRVFLCNSGAEAVETALKLARRHGRATGGPDKLAVVAAAGGFHGRTLGALSVTGQPAKREPFGPLPGPVRFVRYGDASELADAVDDRTAAVILEPVQGEGGVFPAPPGYLAAARALATRHGALLVLDEVQTGLGRTGTWFAHHHDRVVPDVVTVGKGLGGGLPAAGCVGLGPAGRLFHRSDHASTFGGNPIVAAAALAVLDTVAGDRLCEQAGSLGDRWTAATAALRHPLLAGTRGRGLLQALVLTAPRAAEVESAAREAGFLVGAVAPDAVRLAPPLVLTVAELDSFLSALPRVLDTAAAKVGR